MDNQTKDTIRNFVANAKLDKALEAFDNWAKGHGDDATKNAVLLKKGDYKALTRDENMGLTSSSDARMQRARLANAILSMIEDAEDVAGVPTQTQPSAPVEVSTEYNKTPITSSYSPKNRDNGIVLFLAANPTDTAKLQLDKEFYQVFKSLEDRRITYTLKSEFAVTPSLLQTALLKYRPRIVHFSGHGDGGDGTVPNGDTRAIGRMPQNRSGIVLQTSDGRTQLVSGVALANLFKVCLRIFKLEVVLLNACSSEEQASAIFNAGVPFVIGMNAAVRDAAAIQFSAKFYEGLASEGDVEIAFELAKAGVMMENGFANDADIPILYKRDILQHA
jgi:hypothetical protein